MQDSKHASRMITTAHARYPGVQAFIVTEIPLVDKSSEWELLSLLGHWYEPESTESLFSSMPSDAVFFSS